MVETWAIKPGICNMFMTVKVIGNLGNSVNLYTPRLKKESFSSCLIEMIRNFAERRLVLRNGYDKLISRGHSRGQRQLGYRPQITPNCSKIANSLARVRLLTWQNDK